MSELSERLKADAAYLRLLQSLRRGDILDGLIKRLDEAAARLDQLEPPEAQALCHICGKPATCIGIHDQDQEELLSCDDCCAHGLEDGTCRPITPEPQGKPR